MNSLLAALKIVAEYYPGRLYKACVIDPPSLFSYIWKVILKLSLLASSCCVQKLFDLQTRTEKNEKPNAVEPAMLLFRSSSLSQILYTSFLLDGSFYPISNVDDFEIM